MSEQSTEHDPSAAAALEDFSGFAAVMDALAPESADGAAGAGAGQDAGAAGAAGAAGGGAAGGAAAGGSDAGGAAAASPGAAGGPVDTGAAAPTAGAPVAGGADQSADGAAGDVPAGGPQPGADAAGGGADLPASWTVEHTVVAPQLGELSTKLEERISGQLQQDALAKAREDHAQYFEALEKHPRLLVGTQVPRIDGKEGMETLRDAADAREWQDAVKSLLVEEVRDRASRALDEQAPMLQTLHSSIELFQQNPDLVPFTKGFDKELANRFANMVKPYELRDDQKKLNGYSIPVQPIIAQLRTQLQQERAARPATPPAAPTAAAPVPAAPAEPPQAGITSKAGSSTETEDYSTLFGTIGLPNFTI